MAKTRTTLEAATSGTRPSRIAHVICLGVLPALTLAMFANVLFTTAPLVFSSRGTDLFLQFIHWRSFGFGELRQGNLALWNPHLFSGAPFFGGFQSALLYPPNALFLVLPLGPAINWSIALHVFLAGAFVYWWAAYRGLHPLGCLLAGIMFMFGGAYFLHIYAGHLPNLCAMVWAPLLFLAIDGVVRERSLRWVLVGMLAVAMQVLAGHLQYVFYTAVAAGVYSLLCLKKHEGRLRVLGCLAAISLGGGALSAIQLLTGWAEARESLRSVGLAYDFAGAFSFPPENLLTLLAPGFFGNMENFPYWGRWYLWEMSLFVSLTGLVLAVYGAITGERGVRRFSVTMVCVALVLALGNYTPLFKILYHWAPGFDKFRGNSKFIFLVSLFLAMLAAIGLDRIIKRGALPRRLAFAPLIAGLLVAAAALWTQPSATSSAPDSAWGKAANAVFETGESFLTEQAYADADIMFQLGRRASRSFLVAGGTLIVLTLLFLLAGRFRGFTCAIVLLAAVELFVFARGSLDTFDLGAAESAELKEFLAEHPGDYRIANTGGENDAMSVGAYYLWGTDPAVPLRYAQFIAFTQGVDASEAKQFIRWKRLDPLFAMLRCQFAFAYDEGSRAHIIRTEGAPLKRLQLVRKYRVLEKRDEILAAMSEPSFDPRTEVILESQPHPPPVPGTELDKVSLVEASTDSLTVEANLSSPAILLITDSYSRGWRVRAMGQPAQPAYQVMPANYCLRAIPLGAGHHRFRVEYVPAGFVFGKWLSICSVAGYLVTLAYYVRSRRRDERIG